jgi:hypothetical protein
MIASFVEHDLERADPKDEESKPHSIDARLLGWIGLPPRSAKTVSPPMMEIGTLMKKIQGQP